VSEIIDAARPRATDFIREIIDADRAAGKHGGRVVTRFPPEPNGYLHIGHAKSICLNFGLARDYGGVCHLRMDDTNPAGESVEYAESIMRDVRWLGFDWGDKMFFAVDYFERLYEFALELIRAKKAYVCSLNEEEIRQYRGTVTEPGRPSPYRERSVEENLDLLARMRAGEFPDGAHVLRAKIDMASPNMKMRDPLMYRIRHVSHYRVGDKWCIYPLYDFTHGLSDSLEGITHSICTLEFENNRELYDWFIDNVNAPCKPQQIEFARLNLTYTVMSKRRLLELVRDKHVSGWDDPRMPTIAGLRRRGVTPSAIRLFAERIGVAKNLSTVDVALFEHCVREDLDPVVPRLMGVLRPLALELEDLPAGEVTWVDAPLYPAGKAPAEGGAVSRRLPLSRRLFIEQEDFRLEPPKGYHRLSPGARVRLRHGPLIECTGVDKDAAGNVTLVRCRRLTGEEEGKSSARGTLHWVSAQHAVDADVRLYDRLFKVEVPGGDGRDFKEDLNPESLVVARAKVEPALAELPPEARVQFERVGFFFTDPLDSKAGAPVFNRIVGLKDSWAKAEAKSASPVAQKAEAKPAEAAARAAGPAPLSAQAQALVAELGIGTEEARVLAGDGALAEDGALLALLREALAARSSEQPSAKALAVWVVQELRPLLDGSALRFAGPQLVELVALVETGALSAALGRSVLGVMVKEGGKPSAIAEARGLSQINDQSAIAALVDEALAAEAALVERYKAGNVNLMGALVGAVMRRSKGKANAKLVGELVKQRLG